MTNAVTFQTGNGTLRGWVIGTLQLDSLTLYRIRDQFGETRLLRADEFAAA